MMAENDQQYALQQLVYGNYYRHTLVDRHIQIEFIIICIEKLNDIEYYTSIFNYMQRQVSIRNNFS